SRLSSGHRANSRRLDVREHQSSILCMGKFSHEIAGDGLNFSAATCGEIAENHPAGTSLDRLPHCFVPTAPMVFNAARLVEKYTHSLRAVLPNFDRRTTCACFDS